jgi:hypothetical protein
MGRPRERETRNMCTIHQCPEAKHATRSFIKITGTIPLNTERTVANTTQEKLHNTQKRGTKPKGKGGKVCLPPALYFILILIKIY